VLLWGLHMGFTQGLLSSLVADTAPAGLRGTAFGLFNMLTGLVLLAASLLAGLLWDLAGPGAPFLVGAGLAAVVGVGLVAIRWRLPKLGRVPGEEPGA
jgi:MFS family permease